MKDARGAEVNVGDTVIYFTRSGSSMDYKAGTVFELVPKPHPWNHGETVELAKVDILDEAWSWSDKKKPRTVSGVNMVVVTGLPEVKAE